MPGVPQGLAGGSVLRCLVACWGLLEGGLLLCPVAHWGLLAGVCQGT